VRLGPIKAITTVIYAPDEPFETNCARILEGRAPQTFLDAHNLIATTDDRPFPFDLDPGRPETKRAYTQTLWMMMVLVPFFGAFLLRRRADLRNALPYLAVVGLTGMAYLLIEVVLIQRFAIFLGSPVVTFATVLGSLLIFSGAGSLWSARVDGRGLQLALAGLFGTLLLQMFAVPWLMEYAGGLSLALRVALTVLTLAPMAFFMGVPFPFVLRAGKDRFSESSAAMLFAINAATSALAVPLALNISSAWGMRQVLVVSVGIYVAVALALLATRLGKFVLAANWVASAVLVLLLASPWVISRPAPELEPTEGRYDVYALSMGTGTHREDRVIRGGSSRTRVPFEWLFWVVKGDGRTILVDTGFDNAELAQQWRIRNWVRPVDRLRTFGISPDEVTDVILTHAHWDHAGGVQDYPNAQVYIQGVEYDHASSVLSASNPTGRGMRLEHLEAIRRAESEGRLNVVRGPLEFAPGIEMDLGGYHTPGSQWITVETRDGVVVLAGDTTYLYWNNQRHVPTGTNIDPRANLETIEALQRRAGSPFLLMPGHDPRVMRWFPEVSEGAVKISMETH
jgi:glyoxylase-like metal-dependent hydrolase (beta-lactamase superfamily II)